MKRTENTKNNKYIVGCYLRLSRDDNDVNGTSKMESDSINNQRELIKSFVQKHSDSMKLYDIYADDGISGTTFDRPEFNRMIEDVNVGKINCVIVKDLSRFGRDYIEAGRYIQKIFPAMGVRFIALADNYDSLKADRTDSSLIVPVKNFVNDSYCRDISQKVKMHQAVKREKGKFIGAFAPYGYQKNPNDKNELVLDSYAADIVRMIFEWKIEGMSLTSIANKLNDLHILSPAEYKKSIGMRYSTAFETENPSKWAASSVKRILENRVYTGTLEQGKQEKVSYKVSKRINKPKHEWIVVENTHQAIINSFDFDIVQRILKCDGRVSQNSEVCSLFSGILFCADCKTPMIRRVNTYKGKKRAYYICQTKNQTGKCSRHSVEEEKLMQIVLKEIQASTSLMMEYKEIMSMLQELDVNYEKIIDYDTQIAKMKEEHKKYMNLKSGLYEDMKDDLISKDEYKEFHRLYSQKCEQLSNAIEKQKELIGKMFQSGVEAKFQLIELEKKLNFEKLTRPLLVMAVEQIYIYEDKKIEIKFRYADVMQRLKEMKKYCNAEFYLGREE